jgi:hypothetical protein
LRSKAAINQNNFIGRSADTLVRRQSFSAHEIHERHENKDKKNIKIAAFFVFFVCFVGKILSFKQLLRIKVIEVQAEDFRSFYFLVRFDLPVADSNDAVRAFGDFVFVRNDNYRVAFGVQTLEKRHNFDARL